MNDKQVIEHMIGFIEEKEREIQAAKLTGSSKEKAKVVSAIIKELESRTKDED